MIKNPFNSNTEPASFKWYKDKFPLKPIDDNNTNFDLVELKNKSPHCINHGAMNKVSAYDNGGYWRCLYECCRAGCEQIKKLN